MHKVQQSDIGGITNVTVTLTEVTTTITEETTTITEVEASEVSSYEETIESFENDEPMGIITIVSNVTFVDIAGSVSITIDPTLQTVVETIQFQSAEIAYGNVIIYSNDTASPNTITISISEDTNATTELSIETENITVFGYPLDGSFSLGNGSVSLNGTLSLDANLSFVVTGSGTFADSLNQSEIGLTINLDNR